MYFKPIKKEKLLESLTEEQISVITNYLSINILNMPELIKGINPEITELNFFDYVRQQNSVDKKTVERWFGNAYLTAPVGDGNSPIDLIIPHGEKAGQIGIDIKSMKYNTKGLSNESSLSQNFADDSKDTDPLDKYFKDIKKVKKDFLTLNATQIKEHQIYKQTNELMKRKLANIYDKKYRNFIKSVSISDIQYIFFMALPNGYDYSIVAFELFPKSQSACLDFDEFLSKVNPSGDFFDYEKYIKENKECKSLSYVNPFVDEQDNPTNKYGKVTLYSSKKRIEIRLFEDALESFSVQFKLKNELKESIQKLLFIDSSKLKDSAYLVNKYKNISEFIESLNGSSIYEVSE